jgi:hypothetical protein
MVVPFAGLAGLVAIAVGAILFWPRLLQPQVKPLADNAVVVRAMPSQAIPEDSPPQPLPPAKFLQNPPVQPHKVRRYLFPYPTTVGTLKWAVGAPAVAGEHEAKGELVIPADARVEFSANIEFADQPELFDGFGNEELDRVVLRPSMAANWQKGLKQICSRDRLAQLVLNGLSDIKDDSIDDINRLNNLRVLYVDETGITGNGLARLRQLSRFSNLSAKGCRPIKPVLTKLRNSKEITWLFLANCELDNNDLGTIATMPRLIDISIAGNPLINDAGLAKLVGLTELRILRMRNTGVTPACIDFFRKMHRLKFLEIDYEGWSRENQAELKRALRGCKLVRKPQRTKQFE